MLLKQFVFILLTLPVNLLGEYIITPSHEHALAGADFRLNCSIHRPQETPDVLAWTRNTLNVAYMTTDNRDVEVIKHEYTYHFYDENTFGVTIPGTQIERENRSSWKCQDAAGGDRSKNYMVNVVAGLSTPVITGYTGGVNEGQTLHLSCFLHGGKLPHHKIAIRCKTKSAKHMTYGISGITSNVSVQVDRKDDSRNCTCKANDIHYPNFPKTPTVMLSVNYPPDVNVSTRTLPDTRSVSLTCEPSGNPPVYTFHDWKHIYNGTVIRSGSDFPFMSDDRKVLTLHNITYRDNGEYVCAVDNNVTDISGALQIKEGRANLFVEDFPVAEISVTTGNDIVTLECRLPFSFHETYKMHGWKQVFDGTVIRTDEDFQDKSDDRKALTLSNISYSDYGEYFCSYGNGQNNTIAELGTKLDVKDRCFFFSKTRFTFAIGDNASIGIPFYCNPHVESVDDITWKREFTLVPNENLQFSLRQYAIPVNMYGKQVTWQGQINELKIHSLEACLFGRYSVTIYNAVHLNTVFDFEILKSGIPPAPENFRVEAVTETTATLSWEVKADTLDEYSTFFIIQQTNESENHDVTMTSIVNGSMQQNNYSHVMIDLDPATPYIFWMYLSNNDGNSSMCGPVSVITAGTHTSMNTLQLRSKTAILLYTTISFGSVLVILLVTSIIYRLYRKFRGPTYVKLRRDRIDGVIYDSVNDRITINSIATEDSNMRGVSMVDYTEISELLRSMSQNSKFSSDSSYYHPGLSAESLEDLQNYENTKLN